MAARCKACGHTNRAGHRFCTACGGALAAAGSGQPKQQAQPTAAPTPTPPAKATPTTPPQPAATTPTYAAPAAPGTVAGRKHSATMALILALLIPGAGQAYNGRPVRGFFILFLSVLVLPWLLSIWGAYATAKRMCAEGGRYGKGGLTWVVLQVWLVLNVTAAVLIILTANGVLR